MANMKILVVDDEKIFSDNLTSFLKILGYEVFNTYSGEEALNILEKEKPDVLICDLKLSKVGTLNGDDVLTHLKQVSPKTVPVIITAFKGDAMQEKLAERGVVRCIFKPVNFGEIEALLKELAEELDRS